MGYLPCFDACLGMETHWTTTWFLKPLDSKTQEIPLVTGHILETA
jgi:hypothetical protein